MSSDQTPLWQILGWEPHGPWVLTPWGARVARDRCDELAVTVKHLLGYIYTSEAVLQVDTIGEDFEHGVRIRLQSQLGDYSTWGSRRQCLEAAVRWLHRTELLQYKINRMKTLAEMADGLAIPHEFMAGTAADEFKDAMP